MINPTFDMLNQRGTPMFFSDVFANRPTAAIVGRIFVSTDTFELFGDSRINGSVNVTSTLSTSGSINI